MVKIENLKAGYRNKRVINDLNFVFKDKIIYGLLGPNGSGKTTFLKALLGFLPEIEGNIIIKGKDLKKWKRKELAGKISLIPQNFITNFDHKVKNFILMGRYPYLGYLGNYSSRDMEKVNKVMREFSLYEMRDKYISELSGGEKQRCAIARTIVQEADIILMDEAFSHLDINHQIEIMQLLKRINQNKDKQIILVSHNINLAAEYCDEMIFLKSGKLVMSGEPEGVLTGKNLREIYDARIEIIKNPHTGKPNFIYV